MKSKTFERVKGFQDEMKRGGKPDILASDYTDLSSDKETKKK